MNCPVCLEKFTNPVVLPCGHTLCRHSCAERLVKDDCLKCPTCRTMHWVPGGEQNLPRNYALQEFMDTPDQISNVPRCLDHSDTNVSLFCSQCYVLVCLRCCLGPLDGSKPKHFQHEVIPMETAGHFIQNVMLTTGTYLQSRRDEEMARFENLTHANKHFQKMLKKGHHAVQSDHKRLKQLLDDQRKVLIGQLQSLRSASKLPHQSQTSLERVLEYGTLLDECERINHGGTQRDDRPLWEKCQELGSVLRRIDQLSSTPDQSIAEPFHEQVVNINTEPLEQVIEQTLTLITEPPSPPCVTLADCVFGDTSASISWTHQPAHKINYFTVYYETAIFIHGQCKDGQSFDVTDFGRCSGQATIRDLRRGVRYRVFIVARNDAGASPNSAYLYFKANSGESDVKLI